MRLKLFKFNISKVIKISKDILLIYKQRHATVKHSLNEISLHKLIYKFILSYGIMSVQDFEMLKFLY